MGGSGGCGRPLGAGDSRRDMPANSTWDPQPTLFFTPKVSWGGEGWGGLFCSERYFL